MLTGVMLEDKISLPSKRKITDAGTMIVPCAFARTGVQIYTAKSLGLVDEDPSKLIEVVRKEEDVFDEKSLETYRSIPVTIGHPVNAAGKPVQVTSRNAKKYQVGMLEGLPTRDEDYITGTLVISDKEAIDAIEENTKELSCGYTCDISEVDGVYYQSNIKANHIAIVKRGRAGSACAISDEEEVKLDEEINELSDSSEDIIGDTEQSLSPEVLEEVSVEIKEVEVKDDFETEYTEQDLSEAAEAMANEEEMETSMKAEEAQWAAHYAVSAMATYTAHKELSKAARKFAEKLHKSVKAKGEVEYNDEAELTLVDDIQTLVDAIEGLEVTIGELNAENSKLYDSISTQVADRCDFVFKAKEIADIDEKDLFKLSTSELRKKVVEDCLSIDLVDKSDDYVSARFDALYESRGNTETPLGKMLRDQLTVVDCKEAYIDPVKKARDDMIKRNSKSK